MNITDIHLDEPTRAGALRQLADFLPKAGAYAENRNFDEPGHPQVSRLSPYIGRRLITEAEVVSAAREACSPSKVEKFVQEVAWRTYWKGWLELRPSVWAQYLDELGTLKETYAPESVRGRTLSAAEEGKTGIECFDHWAKELVQNNYLHNHSRMWFASIWIFTLKLPWQLGADFFYRHLLDGDAASNTLSWRWVAGLQTLGKHYIARSGNIARFTNGRFEPSGQLNEDAEPMEGPPHPPAKDGPAPLEPLPPVKSDKRLGLLILGDDLYLENSPLAAHAIQAIAGGWPSELAETHRLSQAVSAFNTKALEDAGARAAKHFNAAYTPLGSSDWRAALHAWYAQNKLNGILVMAPATGPWKSLLEDYHKTHPEQPIHFARRAWDTALWPHARAGFFKFKSKLPALLGELC